MFTNNSTNNITHTKKINTIAQIGRLAHDSVALPFHTEETICSEEIYTILNVH